MGERIKTTAKKPLLTKENSAPHKQKTSFRSQSSHVDRILYLQRTIGNQAVQRLIRSGALQAKLMIGQPGDVYELEADRVADEVMRMSEPHKFHIQRACSECKEVDEEDTGQTEPVVRQQAETLLQRENGETTTLPSTPEFRLQMPTLGGGSSPPFSESHLVVPPLRLNLIEQQLDSEVIRQGLSQIEPGAPTVPSPREAVAVGAPAPEITPMVPAGPGPETPREGSAGDVLRAIAAVPAIESTLQGLQTAAFDRVRRDWDRLSTGERVTVITVGVLVGGGGLAGVLSHPETRQMAIGMLNGQTFPIPGVRGLNVELNLRGEDWMVGFHLDVGALLPESWGFGPRSPTAIGGPPTPPERQTESEEEEEPLQPKGESNQVVQVTSDLEERINALRGRGKPLSEAERAFFEQRFGRDFSQVRVHTDAQAAESAREVNAQAFTLGNDVIFSSGYYAPQTLAGKRLLAHELTHVLQQKRTNTLLRQQKTENPIIQLVADQPSLIQRNCTPLYDTNYEPSTNNCEVYQNGLASRFLTWTYRHNATCACENTPNDPKNNCIRKCLQVKMNAFLRGLNRSGAVIGSCIDPFGLLNFACPEPYCRSLYNHHVDCYRECCCDNDFIGYPAFWFMCEAPYPCFFVSWTIGQFNSCED
jgi:hypothetical protein